MSEHTFDTFAREAADGISRRSSLLSFGGAALAAALMSMIPAGAPSIEAKGNNKGKKAKKKLKKVKKQFAQACEAQPEQCQAALQATCPLFGEQAAVCLQIFTPCCAQFTDCDVNPGIACMITALAAQQQQM